MKRNIPNAITLLNLFFGCCAILNVLDGQLVNAFWFFLAAALADFLDGLIARLLGAHSPVGKELDSLADVISFGFFPGVIFYYLLLQGPAGTMTFAGVSWGAAPAFLVTLFSALRLAKFNLDERQTDHFIGLPTPSASLFTSGLMLIYHFDSFGWGGIIARPAFLYSCIALISALLVAELPMFSLKFKSLKWTGNEIRFVFAGVIVLCLVTLKEAAPAFIIIFYILVSVALKMLNKAV